MRYEKILAATAMLLAAGSAALAADAPKNVADAVASVGRPPQDIARDVNRKPAEMLAFAGVKPSDKVLELIPAGGYYTRLLSKAVGPTGKIYGFMPFVRNAAPMGPPPGAPAGAPPGGGMAPPAAPAAPAAMNAPIAGVLAISQIKEFDNVQPILQAGATGPNGYIGIPEQVDVVWTSDNYHDFHNEGPMGLDMAAINKSIFRNLKPGGVYIIIDHATAKGAGFTQTSALHRIDPEAVKKEVLAAGFVLDGESKALANPKDDHKAKTFEMQGKTDEFVLRFKKPLNAADTDGRPKADPITLWYGNTFVLGTPDKRTRTIFYHPDGTYQEFGATDMQAGTWYWTAEGTNCMIHQFPAAQNGFVTCHPYEQAHKDAKIGDTFVEGPQKATVALVAGYQYPNVAPNPPPAAPAAGGAPAAAGAP